MTKIPTLDIPSGSAILRLKRRRKDGKLALIIEKIEKPGVPGMPVEGEVTGEPQLAIIINSRESALVYAHFFEAAAALLKDGEEDEA